MAVDHFERAISYAKQIAIKEDRMISLYCAMVSKGQSLHVQRKTSEAKVVVYLETYTLMTEAYSPDHHIVLMNVNFLIKVLVHLEEIHEAEPFARICYDSWSNRDGGTNSLTGTHETEQIAERVADAAESLAMVIFELADPNGEGGDVAEAERLARKALTIEERIYGPNHPSTAGSRDTLTDVLIPIGDHYEVKDLLERCLALTIRIGGVNCMNVTISNYQMGKSLWGKSCKSVDGDDKTAKLRTAVFYFTETIRISTKLYGPYHQRTINFERDVIEIMDLQVWKHAR
jgi:hypothetical protein